MIKLNKMVKKDNNNKKTSGMHVSHSIQGQFLGCHFLMSWKNWYHLILSVYLGLSSVFSVLSWITLTPMKHSFDVRYRKQMRNASSYNYSDERGKFQLQ